MSSEDIIMLEGSVEQSPSYVLALFILAAVSLILALYGFKLLRISVIISAAYIGYGFGSYNLGTLLIGDSIAIDGLPVILGIITAVILTLVAFKLYKLLIFFETALGVYMASEITLGGTISEMEGLPLSEEIITTVISIVLAIVIAFIVYKFFKPYYIVVSSLAGMIFFFASIDIMIELINVQLAETLMPIFLLLGLVAGILAAVKQFRSCKDIEF